MDVIVLVCVCGHGACPCHACASGFIQKQQLDTLRYRTGA